jgi:hypothetical protein
VRNEELIREVVRALGDVDSRALFWVDVIQATRTDAAAPQVDWEAQNWREIRDDVDRWLDELQPSDCPARTTIRISDDVMLVFQARTRTEMARGWKGKPSLTLAETAMPPLQFADGREGSLYDLSIEEIEGLASGHVRLALELPSHRETWQMLLGHMRHFSQKNTAEIEPVILEPYASMLGLTEPPPELGDFDSTWRDMNR